MATTIRRWVKWRKKLDYKVRKEKEKNEFDTMKEKLIWQRWWKKKTENKTIVKSVSHKKEERKKKEISFFVKWSASKRKK